MEKHRYGELARLLYKMIPFWVIIGILAQPAISQTITGEVTDATSGETLPGVNVVVKGTAIGTATNAAGEYKLKVPSLQDTLMFSFVGYRVQEVAIDGRTSIDVVMELETIAGGELIVTGYTAQREQDITAAISSVDMESAEREISASVLDRLDGKVAGLTVQSSGSPGARNTVRIRGISSFQNNDPLYIVDGTPVQDSYLNFINPADIASMQVLKDASAASIYGSRANNGVVIIETKKGGGGSQPEVTINARTGVATPIRGYNDFVITDALQYHEVLKRSFENAGEPVPTNIYGNPDNPSIPNYVYPNDGTVQTNDLSAFGITEDDYEYCNCDRLIMPGSAGTDWWDAVFGPAMVQDYNVGVAGGGSDYNYNVSFNYLDQEGTAAYNHFKRGSIRVNTQFDAGVLTLGENISVSLDENVGGIPNNPGGFAEGGIIGKNILMQPVVPVYDVGGNFASGKANTLGNQSNPLKAAWASKDSPTQTTRMFGNVFGRLDLLDNNLSITSRLGFNLSETSGSGFSPLTLENSEPGTSLSISEFTNRNTEWTWSNTANYVNTFAENHNITLLVGQEANAQVFRGIGGSMAGLLDTDPSSRYLQDALGDPDTKNVNSGGFKARLLSFFGKVDYNYAERYYLSATLRRDGSSRLGSTNQWGTFPAFSLGWRASNESFLQDNETITNLMIRAGYGVTGNQQIPAGSTVNQFGGDVGDTFYNISGDGSSVVQGFRQTVRGNPDLKWEENESVNVGLDLELLGGKYSFALDVYQRDTNDLLFAPQLPATAGVASPPVVNIGQMRNTGFDISLGTRGTIGDELNWNLSVTGSHYQNEILKIDGTSEFFFGTAVGTRHGFQPINHIGEAIGSFYGLQTDGLFMNQDEVDSHATQDGAAPGRLKFVDTNGDGVINADDRTIIGSPHPDFTGGLDFGLQYKNWDLNTSFFASIGNDIYDVQKEYYIFRTFSTTVREDLLTKSAVVENGVVQNPDAEYPEINLNDTFSGGQPSEFWVEDGSYLRLRNIQIGYTLPAGTLPGLRNMRIYISGQNLFTITGYDGLDPSLPAANVSNAQGADTRDQYFGIDRGSYPTNRIISIGINASF
jgi:TonB-linked SusC/RagA family outer membrane protein